MKEVFSHPLITVLLWLITGAASWGAFNARMSALEKNMDTLHAEVSEIRTVLMEHK